jgi:Tol biopolymer transport system component
MLGCVAIAAALTVGCNRGGTEAGGGGGGDLPTSLKEVPAARLNYRYEADVPKPPDTAASNAQERNASVQADFDQSRPQELLDKTVASPDGKRVLAVYHRLSDLPAEFRLDMYSGDGKVLKKVTADTMAVHFPDTIVWSPNSVTVAFVAMLRGSQPGADGDAVPAAGVNANINSVPQTEPSGLEGTDANAAVGETNTAPPAATPAPPTGVLTFRTEQMYLANADGDGVKPITQNEGLIYFYYVWSPDSSMLAAMATTAREWQLLQAGADSRGETFIPVGRPRIIEKSGRERRLDDNMTAVQPVWSPDSSKVAVGYDKQVRIYDAVGNTPSQAAVPLRNNLLISSAAYDREQERKLREGNTAAADANAQGPPANAPEVPTTLPDERTLVSFNPIVELEWPSDDLLYFQTAFIKRMKNEADSVTSFPRWHRLVLTPQPVAGAK